MTSAEHAPTPPAGPGPGDGSVIHLAHRSRRTKVPLAAVEHSSEQELAFTVQSMLLASGQSLNDPATASTFVSTLDAVLLLVDGARAHDVVGESQYQDLRVMLEEMRRAPELV
ncbi:hypothetical protein [Streptomyces sp. NBC_01353]|uniref:hypothetical protein n=1 Tax=Streptomyces sp. NBC_01353 TaxID=2903835 RepID=UPI002E34F2C7|nr:hypothetical protein [Streptomyces sp. NBC_01353]